MADETRDTSGITQLLIAWSDGRREALDDLVPLVYDDLRRLAAGRQAILCSPRRSFTKPTFG